MKVGVSSTLAPSSFQKLGSQPKFADSSSGLNCAGAGAGAAGLTDAVGLTDAAIRVPDAGPVALAGAAARRKVGNDQRSADRHGGDGARGDHAGRPLPPAADLAGTPRC